MKLIVKLHGYQCSNREKMRLQLEFRDAVLEACPSLERLEKAQRDDRAEYRRAIDIGFSAVANVIGRDKTKGMSAELRFEK